MNQLSFPCVKQAWDSTEMVLDPQPPLSLCSKDTGSLPLYPKLGEPSWYTWNFNWKWLPYPCGLLSRICPRHRRMSRNRSMLEPDQTLRPRNHHEIRRSVSLPLLNRVQITGTNASCPWDTLS